MLAAGQRSDADVLVVVDMQNSFVPGGSLAVPGGAEVVPLINRLAAGFSHVVLTQDWHPPGHVSFASSHPARQPFDTIAVSYGQQMLWPDHCVQGSEGAALVPGLEIPHAMLVVRKGIRRAVDSYSAFAEADGSPTGLAGFLRERGITQVFLCGLATDFCVGLSAVDAARAGFAVGVVEDACRGIDANGSLAAAWQRMGEAGVRKEGLLF